MKIIIDNGKEIDWGKASRDYAKYRDIYPAKMYEKLFELGVGRQGEYCLDVGTGTGVLPRNMIKYGAYFTGMDLSENQVLMARELSKGQNIEYLVGNAEQLPFEDEKFNSLSAVQCWWYFDESKVIPEVHRVLKKDGVLCIAYMQWLPGECEITRKSLELVSKFNPDWKPDNNRISFENIHYDGFYNEKATYFNVDIPFTYDTWNGRMKACRGLGASLSPEKVEEFSREHLKMLTNMTDDNFTLKHQIAIYTMKKI